MNIPPLPLSSEPSKSDLWKNIPKELRERPHWCVSGKDKRPRIPATGLPPASSIDPATWRDFETACAFAVINDFDIGYMLHSGDGLVCIDLDVKDSTPPELLALHDKIVDSFDSYTEFSRSGRGRHVWVKGLARDGLRRDGVEIYAQGRYMVCTGNASKKQPISDREELLNLLALEIERNYALKPLADRPEIQSDEKILEHARAANNAGRFDALFLGNWAAIGHDDHSKADFSLLRMLAFCSRNNAQVKRLFLQSQLGQRDKAKKRRDYVDRTIEAVRKMQACGPNAEHGKEVAEALLRNYELKRSIAAPTALPLLVRDRLRLISADEIAARPPIKWLVRGIIPATGIGAIYGQPGSGKSFLVLDLLAALSEGNEWFGRPTKVVPVVYIVLEGQGGLPQRIRAYRERRGSLKEIFFIDQPIDLRQKNALEELIVLLRNAGFSDGVICIDTLAASAPGMDENASTDMGELIGKFQLLQHALGGFVLVVHHSGKDEAKGLRGWSGLNGAVDCAITVTRISPLNKKDAGRRWAITKSKDGRDGLSEDFQLDPVALGFDEDGCPVTSCVVSSIREGSKDAQENLVEKDNLVWQWIKDENEIGKFPSGRSLEEKRQKLEKEGEEIDLTQLGLRDAINHLLEAGRVVRNSKPTNRSGGLKAVDPWMPDLSSQESA